ncbi:MAG TPA: hypothetical protein VHI13_08840 [Candidatus Kapabacteria bacterium]|nr:hypothetical protein [Candidatus Kapabacteria bacterium]
MKQIATVLFLFAVMAGPMPAQSPALYQKNEQPGSGYVQIKPQAVPTSLTAVAKSDAYLDQVVISCTGTPTVTLQDNQGTPVPLIPTLQTAAGTIYVMSFPRWYWTPGGFSISASTSGCNWYASWRQ